MTEVYLPTDVDDAVRFLAGRPDVSTPIAGGTDVLVDKRLGRIAPEWLVDVSRIPGLDGLTLDGDRLTLGAACRIRRIELDPALLDRATALAEAARLLGSVQIRVMATVGGNICHATPSAEMPPALLVHDAVADVVGPGGGRSLPLADVFAGPGRTTLSPGDLLAAVRARVPESGAGSCYLRQTVRWSMDLAGVGVAAYVEARDEAVALARIALAAVSPVPMRVPDAERVVAGTAANIEAAGEAGRLAAAACSPISDARGTAEYRRSVVAALVPRALRIAWMRATGEWPRGALAPPNGVLPGGPS